MSRTAESIRVKFQSLQREAQRFLAAWKSENSQQGSEMSDDNVEELAMKLYRTRAGRKDNERNAVFSLTFRYTSSV